MCPTPSHSRRRHPQRKAEYKPKADIRLDPGVDPHPDPEQDGRAAVVDRLLAHKAPVPKQKLKPELKLKL